LDSDRVNALSLPAEVFYRRLMSVVDDFGRFDGRPAVLRSRLYSLRIDSVREADISRWSAECAKAGLIALYAVDGKPYLLFHKLGSPRAKDSRYPAPPAGVERPEDASAHPFTDVNARKQPFTDVPYSGSGSGASSYSGASSCSDPPEAGRPAAAIPPELDTPEFRIAWGTWKAQRAAKRLKPYTPVGEAGQFKALAVIGPAAAVECIEDSIRNEYQGLFPKKFARRPTVGPTLSPSEQRARLDARIAEIAAEEKARKDGGQPGSAAA
jgi:hypothetical protein